MAAKLTQEQVAEISGIDYKVYQHIEAGRRKNLQLKTIDRFAWVYGIRVSELFGSELPAFKLCAEPKKKIPRPRGRKKKKHGIVRK